jgi:ABC-type ATPase with predicted acetyltransferase domain
MKNLAHLTIFAVLLTGLISPVEAIGQDKSCQFEATGTDDVYLVIREKAGPGETREIVVWEGWVKKDQKKRYASQTGQVRYDYRLSSDDRTYGDNRSSCEDGKTIRIP